MNRCAETCIKTLVCRIFAWHGKENAEAFISTDYIYDKLFYWSRTTH